MNPIPNANTITDPTLRSILTALKEAIEVLDGQRGQFKNKALTVQDLISVGMIRVHNDKIIYNPNAPATPGFTLPTPGSSVSISGITGSLEAIDPATGTTKTFTITSGAITGMA